MILCDSSNIFLFYSYSKVCMYACMCLCVPVCVGRNRFCSSLTGFNCLSFLKRKQRAILFWYNVDHEPNVLIWVVFSLQLL